MPHLPAVRRGTCGRHQQQVEEGDFTHPRVGQAERLACRERQPNAFLRAEARTHFFRPAGPIDMRDTLENLYFGNITPNEQDITPGSVLADAMDQAEQCEEKLTARLEGEEKTLLLRLLNAENEICSTMALENYIRGFRLRMRIAIEALDEDDGNLTMTQEEGGTYHGKETGQRRR